MCDLIINIFAFGIGAFLCGMLKPICYTKDVVNDQLERLESKERELEKLRHRLFEIEKEKQNENK